MTDSTLIERLLADVLRAPDPVAALRQATQNPELPESVRTGLACADPKGIRVAALLVARLRFERLIQGSHEAAAWYQRDPERFAEAFRRYAAEVMPTAFSPAQEAQLFNEWRAQMKD